MSYCKVKNCRYPNTHTTSGHMCGNCYTYGHGKIECGDDDCLEVLDQYSNDVLPSDLQCTIDGCNYKELHTTESHQSNVRIYKVICPICTAENIINKNQTKIFGCSDDCCVCMDRKAEVFFPSCGHLCICVPCCKKTANL